MLIGPQRLSKIYRVQPQGILHVGAHHAEEATQYESTGWFPVYWVDANGDALQQARKFCQMFPNFHHLFFQGLIWSSSGKILDFNIANNGQSSSIYSLGTHKESYPDIGYTSVSKIKSISIEDLIPLRYFFDFINLDIQGAELEAIKGLGNRIESVKYIYTEVNVKPVYKNISLVNEIDDYLSALGFVRVATYWQARVGWGDALYLHKSHIDKFSLIQKILIVGTQYVYNLLWLKDMFRRIFQKFTILIRLLLSYRMNFL